MNGPQKQSAGGLIHPRPVFSAGRLIWAVVIAVLAVMIAHALVTNPNFRWDVVWYYLFHPTVVRGIGYTIALTVGAMIIGVILAIMMAVMRESLNPFVRAVAWVYIWFFRGTPIYTQLIFWGLLPTLYRYMSIGIPFGPEFFTFETRDVITAGVAALLGLGLNEGAYLAEIVRSGLNSVDRGQNEAATALGMNHAQIMRRIILPQAMRVIVPPTGNETISMLKTTSLVGAVPFTLELTYATQTIGNKYFLSIPLLIVAALWYLAVTSLLMVGQYYLERYYGRGFDTKSVHGGRKRNLPKTAAINAAHTTPEDTTFLEATP